MEPLSPFNQARASPARAGTGKDKIRFPILRGLLLLQVSTSGTDYERIAAFIQQ